MPECSLTNIDGPRRGDPEYRFQKSGRVGTQNANSLQPMFLQIVREASGSIGRFKVCSAQHLAIGCDVDNRLRLRPSRHR